MSIKKIFTHNVAMLSAEATVKQAVIKMHESNVGSIIIVNDMAGAREPVGIITDRDILIRAVADQLEIETAEDKSIALDRVSVQEIMTTDLLSIQEEAGVQETLEVMRLKTVRRAPVINKEGRLLGIVSVDDILDHIADELHELSKLIKHQRIN